MNNEITWHCFQAVGKAAIIKKLAGAKKVKVAKKAGTKKIKLAKKAGGAVSKKGATAIKGERKGA